MFKMIAEKKRDNRFSKIYKAVNEYNTIDVINKLVDNNVNITNVYIVEDADIGLKTIEGNYSFETFMKLYKELDKDVLCSLVLYLEDETKIYLGSGEYISLISDYDIDFNDYFEKKKRK